MQGAGDATVIIEIPTNTTHRGGARKRIDVMDHRPVRYPYWGRLARKRPLNGPCGAVTAVLLAASLTACTDGSAAVVKPAMYVRTEIVQPRVRQGSVTLTGELQARFGADLSFRVSGRVRERLV